MRKLVALLMAIMMLVSLTPVMAEDEVVTLTFGSIWSSDTETNKAPLIKTIEEFEALYPNIKIEVDWNEANAWKTKGDALATQDAMPDVYYWNAGGILKAKVDMGQVLNLSDYLDQETLDRIMPGTLADLSFDGKIYGLPYTTACSVLYCNKDLFTKYDVKLPETWDELMTAVKTFRDNGVVPMTTGGSDRWPTNMYTDIIFLRAGGDEANRNAYYKKEGGTFKSPDMIEGAQLFLDLVQAGAFPEDVLAITRDESEVPFKNGEVAMYMHGQWAAAGFDPEKVVAIKFPTLPNHPENDNAFMGGAAEGFMVAAYTEHKEEAVLFCTFVAENLSKNGYIAGAGLPAWKYDFSEYEIAPLMAQIKALTETADSFLLWGNTALEGEDAELLMDQCMLLLGDEITAEDFAETMETIF